MNETKRRGRDRTLEVDVLALALTVFELREALTKLSWELIPLNECSECPLQGCVASAPLEPVCGIAIGVS